MNKNTKTKATSLVFLLFLVLLLSAFAGVQFAAKADDAGYTETVGTLDGASFVVRFPDNWNGMLAVHCRGYSATPITDPKASITGYTTLATNLLSRGFAVASSAYGAGGYCVKRGMNDTYQLTKYLVDTYNITGKVFLVGFSMGGNIALLLGEKYPDVYSGVLDLFGTKDLKDQYETKSRWANLSDADLAAELTALTVPIPPYTFGSLTFFRSFCASVAADVAFETGGTPANASEAYEDISPVYHANSIPVITVHGTSDAIVPYYESVMYQTAVANAGRSNLYRLYNVTGGEHVSPSVMAEVGASFAELVEWSDTIPEGLSIEVLMLLSSLAVIVSARYFRKRAK